MGLLAGVSIGVVLASLLCATRRGPVDDEIHQLMVWRNAARMLERYEEADRLAARHEAIMQTPEMAEIRAWADAAVRLLEEDE